MQLKVKLLGILALVSLLASSLSQPASAQDPQPPAPPDRPASQAERGPAGARYDPQRGEWYREAGVQPARVEKEAIYSSNLYGYTQTSPAYSWVDAVSGGTVVAFPNQYSPSGAISLPFNFKYYENTYSSFYIIPHGYLALGNSNVATQGVLNQPWPRNIIAPYWAPFWNLATSGSTNRVYTRQFGAAPNRYVAVEWYQAKVNSPDVYTFEVILYENGSILFQYQTITAPNGFYCGTAGIRDNNGYDFLITTQYCYLPDPVTAVLFTRPAAGAHAYAYPPVQGATPDKNNRVEFPFYVLNTGDLGADRYDFYASPSLGWSVSLFTASGVPLQDTNGNGRVDTGSLAPRQLLALKAVATPLTPIVNIGFGGEVILTVVSAADPNQGTRILFYPTIPPVFGQVYHDNVNAATSLDLLGPAGTQTFKTSPDNYYGYYQEVATAPNGNLLTIWQKGRSLASTYVRETEYAVNSSSGASLRSVTKLDDYSAETAYTYDYSMSVTASPNGRFGITWVQEKYDNQGKHLYNVFFAVLDSSGNIIVPPANLTNLTQWSAWGDYNIPVFYRSTIAATTENRFVVAYESEINTASGSVNDIYTAIRDTAGGLVQGPVQRTADTPGWDQYYESPNLAALGNNQVLLTFFAHPEADDQGIVLTGAGTVAKSLFYITNDGPRTWEYAPKAVLLPNGKVFIGWSGSYVGCALLDPAQNFLMVSGPKTLYNPFMQGWEQYVSVTTDAASHGIITWTDQVNGYSSHLYYAALDGNGAMAVYPTMLRSASNQTGYPYIDSSSNGSGNTRLAAPAAPAGIDLYITPPNPTGGPAGGTATLFIDLGNQGLSSAASTLTANLGALGYVDSNLAPSSVNGGIVTWNLSQLDYLGKGKITLTVSIPGGAANGAIYPVPLSIQPSVGPDDAPANNSQTANVLALNHQAFLPLVSR